MSIEAIHFVFSLVLFGGLVAAGLIYLLKRLVQAAWRARRR